VREIGLDEARGARSRDAQHKARKRLVIDR
jgi:hypothetical protein